MCSWIQSGTSAGHLLRYTLNVCFWQPLDITLWQPSKWSSKIHNLRMKQPFLYEIDFGIRSDVIMINGRLSWLSQHEEPEAAWKCFHCTPGCRCTLLENHCAMTSSLITIFQRRDVDRLKCTTAFWRTILFWLLYERSCLAWRMKMWEEWDFLFSLLPWEELSSCMNKLYIGPERRGQRWYFPTERYGRYERDMDGWGFMRWRFALSSSSLRHTHTHTLTMCHSTEGLVVLV